MKENATVYNFEVETLDGKPVNMKDFSGKALLIVNTASKCGFTPQYQGLEELYEKYRDKGFVILGFPCNQFGRQEPGSGSDIRKFCDTNYNISFPLFSKIKVNGADSHPLYKFLKNEAPGKLGIQRIPWNFTKFLISKDGKVIRRFSPATRPDRIEPHIQKLLER